MKSTSNTIRMLIWIIFLFGGAIGGVVWDLSCCPGVFKNPVFHLLGFIIGLLLLRLVIRASRNTGRYLAAHGKKGSIPKFETNQLVTTGYYACMRHPMHFGLLFFPWAWAFLVGSVTFILIIAPLEMILMLLMIKFLEEREAQQKFGKQYLDYKAQVPFFSFKRECLKKLFAKDGIKAKEIK